VGDLRHLNPLIYNECQEPINRNVIHGFGKLNVSKLYKGEETFDYTLLQSSLCKALLKNTLLCIVVVGAMLYAENKFFPLLSPIT